MGARAPGAHGQAAGRLPGRAEHAAAAGLRARCGTGASRLKGRIVRRTGLHMRQQDTRHPKGRRAGRNAAEKVEEAQADAAECGHTNMACLAAAVRSARLAGMRRNAAIRT